MTRGEVMMGICIHGAELWERWVRGISCQKLTHEEGIIMGQNGLFK
jgi:hypothetical protein